MNISETPTEFVTVTTAGRTEQRGMKVVRKRLADGTERVYRYWGPTGGRIFGEPGSPEFKVTLATAKTFQRPSKQRIDWNARAYTSRLLDYAARIVKTTEFRAKANGWAFDLTEDHIRDLFRQQGERCAVTGLRFELDKTKVGPFHPSLDRITPKLGYVAGNVRVVCFAVNVAMSDWGEAVFLKIAEAAVHTAWQKHLSPSL